MHVIDLIVKESSMHVSVSFAHIFLLKLKYSGELTSLSSLPKLFPYKLTITVELPSSKQLNQVLIWLISFHSFH